MRRSLCKGSGNVVLAVELFFGAAFLLMGGEALVRGATQIAVRYGLSRLIVGMVIAGFGTSMPELVVSVRAVLADAPGMAAGNVVGSNISNILLILAVAALIKPIDGPRRRLEPEGIALIVVSAGVVLMGFQQPIPRWQGAAMVLLLFSLLALKFQQDQRAKGRQRATEAIVETVAPVSFDSWRPFVFVLLGLLALPVGGDLFVKGAIQIAQAIGVSAALIGLTIVAVGTSLPELATTVVAALRGESTIGYGNIVGSNLFNLLGIFGVSTLVGEMRVPAIMVYADGTVMVAATVAMLLFLRTGARLTRVEAALMLGFYVAYVSLRYFYAIT